MIVGDLESTNEFSHYSRLLLADSYLLILAGVGKQQALNLRGALLCIDVQPGMVLPKTVSSKF